MSAALEIQRQSVSTLLVRLFTFEMLVPKSVVVDIVSWSKSQYISERASSSRLHIGKYTWSSEILPLLSLDKIDSTRVETDTAKSKVVIMRSIHGDERFHYALEARGLPKPLIINESTLRYAEDESERELFAFNVRIGNRRLYIPDLEQLEQLASSQE